MIRKLSLLFFLTITISGFSQNTEFFEKTDKFLTTFVENGRVNYAAIKANPADLDALTETISSYEWSEAEEKAYLINVYNISVIRKIVEAYPINSPTDVNKFFDVKDVILNGDKVSLNHIENKMLRPKYGDPRFHFSLVCGALGCPVLRSEAYKPETLDQQLEEQTDKALNNTFFVYQDSRNDAIFVSEIFIWYREDFGGKDDSIVAYINSYREDDFNPDFKVQSYPYDWTLNDLKAPFRTDDGNNTSDVAPKDSFNLQTFTAGSLLGKNQFDFTLFNTLYTENKQNWLGNSFSGYRSTFMTHLFQVTYGIGKSKRINVGLDFNIRNNGLSTDSTASGIGTAFGYSNTDSTRFGLTSIGARVKIQPFKSVKNFSIQSSFFVPTVKHPEGFNDPADPNNNLYWAEWNRFVWWNQFFFDKTWNNRWQLFAEVDLWFRFGVNSNQRTAVDLPLNVFFSYFPTSKMTFYVMSQHVPRFTYNINQTNTDWVIPMDYTASGVGFKYMLAPGLNLELLYTNFWRGRNTGLGQTFNIGIKYITR